MNNDQFAEGYGCGTCIMFQGLGEGLGTTPPATDKWYRGEHAFGLMILSFGLTCHCVCFLRR